MNSIKPLHNISVQVCLHAVKIISVIKSLKNLHVENPSEWFLQFVRMWLIMLHDSYHNQPIRHRDKNLSRNIFFRVFVNQILYVIFNGWVQFWNWRPALHSAYSREISSRNGSMIFKSIKRVKISDQSRLRWERGVNCEIERSKLYNFKLSSGTDWIFIWAETRDG